VKEYGLYINGEWRESTSGETFETKNPTTGKILTTFPRGIPEDVIKAIDAAEKAFPQWRKYPAPKRGEIILKVAAIRLVKKSWKTQESRQSLSPEV